MLQQQKHKQNTYICMFCLVFRIFVFVIYGDWLTGFMGMVGVGDGSGRSILPLAGISVYKFKKM